MLTSRFWSKVDVGHPLACWKWQAATNRDGYGSFGTGEGTKTILAHRFAWQEFYGEIPYGQCVLHGCDNPACVNPRHLFLGTQADNVADCARKGRRNQSRIRKLTPEQRKQIVNLYHSGAGSQEQIGKLFGVAQTTVSKLVRA